MINEMEKIKIRAKNKNEEMELQKKYNIYNSFEIFQPITSTYFSYAAKNRNELFNKLQKQFSTNNITIRFNKSDITIRELDKIYTACMNADLRIQSYLI